MADNKMGPNLQAGAGFFAKRVQKSLNRAQEKVLQKLGKTMETKDEHFELCSHNLNKQQINGSRLFKDVRAYYAAVKGVHETSKRLSQTLRDVYEPDWMGVQDLGVIIDSEDLLWNDFEQKLSDQIVRTMENYNSQFPEVKERVAKRGRKLVDYDSARHHLEALQGAKKKDEAKISKAEEEFNKAQNVFEEINKELREELPVLYQSRIGCYVTVFQNISNLRDVFYKEMSVLNNELYNVMKKLETQHSGKAFIIKGLHSPTTKSKKRKSLVISNPIPCNTAFPEDHVSIQSSNQNGKGSAPLSVLRTQSISEGSSQPEESSSNSKGSSSSESDLSSSGASSPKRQSTCDNEGDMKDRESQSPEEEESRSEDSGVGGQQLESACQEASGLDESVSESPDQDIGNDQPAGEDEEVKPPAEEDQVKPPAEEDQVKQPAEEHEVKPPAEEDQVRPPAEEHEVKPPAEEHEVKPPVEEHEVKPPAEEHEVKPSPVPAPRVSFRNAEKPPVRSAVTPAEMDEESLSRETMEHPHNPPGFLYKGLALESHAASEEGLLPFERGDIILVLDETQQQDGLLRGIREESWKQHHRLENLSGIFSEKLVQPE